ncbi:MAG: OmpA family protein, partial [Deltaproteobacteria bacterium]|nr:OmpA family protein [Deltaproteobacteria bacterium]
MTLSDLLLLLMIFFVMLFGLTLQQQPQASPSLPQAEASTKAKETPVETQKPPVSDSASQGILTSLETDLRAILGGGSRKEEVTITRLVNRLVLIFPERIVFDPGRAQLKASARPILQKVALLISAHPYLLVEVQGHTDDRPINTNRYPSNWELSVDRATQVAKALIALGLNPLQTSVKGFGEYR